MRLTYYGHSACLIETSTHRLLIDPFLTGNSQCHVKPEEVSCDFILLTHGHADHIGDTLAIAKANNATVIANYEIATYLESQGAITHPMNVGGGAQFAFGRVQFTIAFHGSSYPGKDGLPIYLGMPAGIIIKADQKTVYHAGDTALTVEMELLARRNQIDLALLPIGDNFTMGIEDALVALEMLKPRATVPIHYNTFPYILVDPQEYVDGAARLGINAIAMQCGDTIEV